MEIVNFGIDRAMKDALADAELERARLGSYGLETEHLLLALLRTPRFTGTQILVRLRIDLAAVKERVEAAVEAAGPMRLWEPPPPPPRRWKPQIAEAHHLGWGVKNVLRYSMEEARALNHSGVGTEHLLLGLLREKDGIAAKVLTDLGISLDEARTQLGPPPL
jgi:ATP-dependent Clp protease ATP-binding subunit ClpC